MSGGRLVVFDNLKFMLIALVVIGHFADCYTAQHASMRALFLFIYSFHMPLFIFVSGLFVKEMGADARLNWNRIISFIALGFLMKAISAVLAFISSGWVPFSLLSDGGPAWFMFAIAAYTAFAWILRGVRKDFVLVFSVALALLAGYDSSVGDYLYLSRIIVFFPFFWAGYCLSPAQADRFTARRDVRIVSAVVIAAAAVVCVLLISEIYAIRWFFTGRNSYEACGVDYAIAFRALAYCISAAMCVAVMALTPRRRIPLASAFGPRTLQVYVWHGTALTLLGVTGAQAAIEASFGSFGFLVFVALAIPVALLLSQPHSARTALCRSGCRIVPARGAGLRRRVCIRHASRRR